MMKRPEQKLQIMVAKYLEQVLPPEIPWTAIGHGGGGAARGKILKAMGVHPGWPDVHLVFLRRACYIELKVPKTGRLSLDQKKVHTALVLAGGVVATCRSVDEVEDFLKVLGVPLRGRLNAA